MRFHEGLSLILFGWLSCAGARDGATEPTPSVRVDEAGWSFGFCLGPCRGDLTLEDTALSYRISDRTGMQVFVLNRGHLSSQGASHLSRLAGALPPDLSERYGCPDCADGGASYVLLSRESGPERAEYEYGNPPPELAALDAFLKGLMEALRECRVTPDLTPEPGCTSPPSRAP